MFSLDLFFFLPMKHNINKNVNRQKRREETREKHTHTDKRVRSASLPMMLFRTKSTNKKHEQNFFKKKTNKQNG